MKRFRVFRQSGKVDCGPCCLRMIAYHYGKSYSLEELKNLMVMLRRGVTLHAMSEAAEQIGFKTLAIKISFEQLDEEVPLPCIVHWHQKHFVVIPPQDYSRDDITKTIRLADPLHGMIKVDREGFLKGWADPSDHRGVVLVLEPTRSFYAGRLTK